MIRRSLLLCGFLVLSLPRVSNASVYDEFTGIRSAAMGGAHRAVGTSNDALVLNPAGMAMGTPVIAAHITIGGPPRFGAAAAVRGLGHILARSDRMPAGSGRMPAGSGRNRPKPVHSGRDSSKPTFPGMNRKNPGLPEPPEARKQGL